MGSSETPPPRPPSPAKTTPRIHRHGVDGLSVRSKDQQQRFAYDIERNVLGPMPTAMFLDKFFPITPNMEDTETAFKVRGIKPDEIGFASVPDAPEREEEMYEGLVSMKQLICCPSNLANLSAPV